ncbi:MAG: dihydrofolate reductase [Lachnospiraceae bacterium]|nr:dihydrofolate reductase [Lachnospiraceae bacterium]
MNLIVAATQNWGIGYQNDLLFRIPEDQQFFKTMTEHKVIVVGRRTLDSFPKGQPLKNRKNIVFTRQNLTGYADNLVVVHNLNELETEIKGIDTDSIFVSGGEEIYRLLLGRCSTAYATMVYKEMKADKFFPDLDKREEWIKTEESEEKLWEGLRFRYLIYKKRI